MKRNLESGYSSMTGVSLNLFTPDNLRQLHLATMELLYEMGVRVLSKDARDVMEKAGCEVNHDTEIVRIPEFVVNEAIKSCPSVFTLYGKTDEFNVSLQPGRVYHSPFGAAPRAEDPYTLERRDAVKQDLVNCAIMIDQLPEYDFCFSTMTATDVDPKYCNIHSFEAHYTHIRKPILASSSRKWTVEYDIEMAAVERGSIEALQEKPTIMFGCCTISPMEIPVECCEVLMTAAENNIPVANMTMSICGSQAPATLAGASVISNAENLAALVLVQAVRKGARYVCGGSPGICDMKHGAAALVGAPEVGLLSSVLAEFGRYYEIPTIIGGT